MRIKIYTPSGEVVLWNCEIKSIVKEKGRTVGLFSISKNDIDIGSIDRMRRVEFFMSNKGVYERVFIGVIDAIGDNGNTYEVGCNGLFFILEKRQKSRSGTQNAGQAIFDILDSCNNDMDTGIKKGINTATANTNITEAGTALSIINNISSVCEYDINPKGVLNVSDRIGEDKNIRLIYSDSFPSQNTIERYDFTKESENIFNKITLKNGSSLYSVVEDAESIQKYGLCETVIYTTLVNTQSDIDALAYQILQLKKEGINDLSITVKNKVEVIGIQKGIDIFDVDIGDSIEFSINSPDLVFSGRRRIKKIRWTLESNGYINLELFFSEFGGSIEKEISETAEKRLSRIEREIF